MGLISALMFRSAKNALPRYGGVMTWNYSQTDYAVWSVIREEKVSAKGICKALAAQWIVDHAYGGSLVNRVTNANGSVNESAIRMVMQNFSLAYDEQEAEAESFLLSRGIMERRGSQDITITKYQK